MNNINYFIFIFLVLTFLGTLYLNKYNQHENFIDYNFTDIYAIRKNEACGANYEEKKKPNKSKNENN